MIPGQMRPTFARNNRLIRRLISVLAGLVALACFVSVGSRSGPGVGPFLVVLIAGAIALQVAYAVRIAAVRRVSKALELKHPDDRFFVANVRLVGASDSGPEGVAYRTVIVQFGNGALSFWDPDKGSVAFLAMPLADLDVDVTKTTPTRWGIVAPSDEGATYLALWHDSGLGFRKPDEMRQLANTLFPGVSIPEPPMRPGGPIGF